MPYTDRPSSITHYTDEQPLGRRGGGGGGLEPPSNMGHDTNTYNIHYGRMHIMYLHISCVCYVFTYYVTIIINIYIHRRTYTDTYMYT